MQTKFLFSMICIATAPLLSCAEGAKDFNGNSGSCLRHDPDHPNRDICADYSYKGKLKSDPASAMKDSATGNCSARNERGQTYTYIDTPCSGTKEMAYCTYVINTKSTSGEVSFKIVDHYIGSDWTETTLNEYKTSCTQAPFNGTWSVK